MYFWVLAVCLEWMHAFAEFIVDTQAGMTTRSVPQNELLAAYIGHLLNNKSHVHVYTCTCTF